MSGTVSGDHAEPKGPLSGMLVVDMSSIVSGPLGSRILADLGATVVKIETATSDIAVRSNLPVHQGHSAYHEQLNFGKKSISVDPKTPEGVKTIRALCKKADVFFQNSRPGVMERLGFGYEALKADNPGLVYVSVTGFGETGPYANGVAYDTSIQGLVGFMAAQGTEDAPQAIYSPVADKITAIWASHAAMGALLYRERNGGVGQKVVIDMVSAYASFILVEEMANETFRSVEFPTVHAPKQPYQPLATADGTVVGLILMPQQYKAVCRALGREDLEDDPRFATTPQLIHGIAEFHKAIAKDVAAITTEVFLQRMRDSNVPFSRVNNPRDFINSDIAAATGAFVDIEDDEFGTIRHLNHPVKYSVSPANVGRRAPKIGEHTDEILAMIAGG